MVRKKTLDWVLTQIYTQSAIAYSGNVSRFINAVLKEKPKTSRQKIVAWLNTKRSHTLHKRTHKRYKTTFALVGALYEQLQVDIMSMQALTNQNEDYAYILVCIDMLSRQAFCRKLKTKNAKDVTSAMKNVLAEIQHSVLQIQTDLGMYNYGMYLYR